MLMIASLIHEVAYNHVLGKWVAFNLFSVKVN